MTNNAAALPLKRPIDRTTLALIRLVTEAAAALGHQTLLVGATARIILIEHVFGLATGRATRDIDFAVALECWEQFEQLQQHLVERHGFERDKNAAHRLLFPIAGTKFRHPVDIVPFGKVGGDREEIRWPPEEAIGHECRWFYRCKRLRSAR